jgi:hypothetical protein
MFFIVFMQVFVIDIIVFSITTYSEGGLIIVAIYRIIYGL